MAVAGRSAVVSFLHEVLVELFRRRPALAVELLRACAGIELDGGVVGLGSIDLTQVVPAEYRTDSLIVLRRADGTAAAAVVTEVQLGKDVSKRLTWPLYVAAARASLSCPVTLLVLAPDPAVAQWASQPIELGHPGHVLRPIVISYGEVPRIVDPAAARAVPELGVLSAMAHPELVVAEAAVRGIDTLPEDRQKLHLDLIVTGLPELARRALEAQMIKGYQYQSEFARKYYGQGLTEGHANGLRSAISELVGARWPHLLAEVAARLRELPEERLLQIIKALGHAHDEASLRVLLDGPPA